MKFINKIERLKKMHKCILLSDTGTPKEFANKLNISRSQLYNLIDDLKEFEAPIKYSKLNKTFYYEKEYDFQFNYSLIILSDDVSREIFGGFYNNPVFMYGININLYHDNVFAKHFNNL